MKRYMSLFCMALILFMCVASPVSASEVQSVGYVDLLGANQIIINGVTSSSTRIDLSTQNGYFTFPIETNWAFGKFELLIYTNDPNINFIAGGSTCTKSPSLLGGNYVVVQGNFNGQGHRIDYTSSGSGYCFILSGKVMPLNYTIPEIKYNFEVYDGIDGELIKKETNVSSTEFNDSFYSDGLASPYVRQIRIYPNKTELAGMDYFDLDIYLQNLEIGSISASFGGNALDVQYTTSFIGDGIYDNGLDFGDIDQNKTNGMYKVVLRVDVSGISLLDGLPTVFITYTSNNYYNYTPYVYVYGINGGVYWEANDPQLSALYGIKDFLSKISTTVANGFNNLSTWIINQTNSINSSLDALKNRLNETFVNYINFLRNDLTTHFSRLNTWIDNLGTKLEAAIRGDTAPGDSFQDEVEDKDKELEDMADVMNSVTQPDIDKIDVSADQYIDKDVLSSSMAGLSIVIGDGVFFDVMVMSLMMATAGYALFGKR